MRIGRTYRFEAAHHLPRVPDGHKCKHMHGHNYAVEIIVSGAVEEDGFVMDFADIDEIVLPLIKQLDHTVLNEHPGLENPTAEVIAEWFMSNVAICSTVRVYENADCWAETGD